MATLLSNSDQNMMKKKGFSSELAVCVCVCVCVCVLATIISGVYPCQGLPHVAALRALALA